MGHIKHKPDMKRPLFFLNKCLLNTAILGLLGMMAVQTSRAQVYSYSDFAKTFSQVGINGSARFQGIGGSHTALGADLTNVTNNPAGLGFYSRNEIILTGGVQGVSTEARYLGQSVNDQRNLPIVPNFGIVLSNERDPNSDWHGTLGISYSRQVNLQQNILFQGQNNRSSLLDNVVESANARGANLFDEYNTSTDRPTSYEAMFYNVFLVDPVANRPNTYRNILQDETTATQTGTVTSRGAVTQFSIAYGGSYREKLYVGLGLGFTSLNYRTQMAFSETFQQSRFVRSLTYDEQRQLTGSGMSLNLGLIYRPTEQLRLGASLTTPTWYTQLEEVTNARLSVDIVPNTIVDQNTNRFITRVDPVDLEENVFAFQLTTPLRASAGAAYFFGSSGFVSLDAEYVGYAGMRVGSDELSASANARFKSDYNGRISTDYQNAMNVKIGAEMRFGPLALRGGAAYLGSPYRSNLNDLDRSMLQLSGGVGFRSGTFFADLSYVRSQQNASYTPYTLADRSAYGSALLNTTMSNVSVSVGTFF
jgi:hypothetical protein